MEFGVFFEQNDRGPGKVARNLIKGMNLLDLKFFINKKKDFDIVLQNCKRLNEDLSNCIIGPNITTLPIDSRIVMDFKKYKKIITPSDWVKDKYLKWIPLEKIEVWAVGIDTNFFLDFSKEEKTNDCLIYFKRRNVEDLIFVTKMLKKFNQSFEIIEYGNYNEEQFLDSIKKSKYCFVIDNCESQGIAIQEMMSCNLPLFVWDVEFWIDRGEEYKVKSTSVPYWDEKCGIKEINKNLIFEKFELFLKNISFFKPRNYVIDNLSLEKQASELIRIFK